MKNKHNYIIKITFLFMIVLLLSSNINYTNAFAGNINNFESTEDVNGVTNVVNNVGGTVITVIRIASVTIAMVILLVIAMKYMLAAPAERADIKKHAVAYIVGAFILFGVTGILTILTQFSEMIKP